ncbi:MAG: sulfatase family protein [Erythrobacter sp.]
MRQRLVKIALGAITLLLGSTLAFQPAVARQQPNVVLIYADDLGYGDVSIYNPQSRIPTPHIDALARSGTWLRDGHSTSTVCTPSRYALLTGQYAWRTELRNGVLMPWGRPVIDPEMVTLPEFLRDAGYETALIGKWHLGFDWPWKTGQRPVDADILKQGWISIAKNEQFDWSQPLRGGPIDHGFDYYFGDDIPNMPPYAWIENDRIAAGELVDVPRSSLISIGFEGGIHGSGPGEPGWQLDQVMPRLVSKSVDYIEAPDRKAKPFFLMVSLTAPHTPVVPLAEYDGKSGAGTYGDFVVQTDAAVGSVMDALDAAGLRKNTLVIVTSDNGPEFPAYRQWKRYGHDSVAGLRGIKSDTWEGGHRVPFVVSWPDGDIDSGRPNDALIAQIDLYATIGALLSEPVEARAAPDSVDVLDALLGRDFQGRSELVYHGSRGNLGLRAGRWAFLRSGGFGRSPLPFWSEPEWVRIARGVRVDGGSEDALYDLTNDPGQLENVVAKHPEIARRMNDRLTEIETE